MHWFFDPGIQRSATQIAKTELVHFRSLRIQSGEQIAITSGKGSGFVARVVDPGMGEIQILSQLESQPKPRVHLFQAIAKGGRDEMALQACVELGVASATAFEAKRSVANWKSKEQKGLERWEQIAISAIKQSQQLWSPEINYSKAARELRPLGVGIVLDPRAELGLAQVPQADEYSIVVGPEGGFSERELLELKSQGFESYRLGRSVLRTSTAGVAAIAALQLLSGEYGGRLG